MKTALFIILPVPSHYNACFGFANNLKNQGYKIIFTGTPDLREHVETQGFEFSVLWCIEEYVVPNWRIGLGLFLKNIADKRFKCIRYKEFLQSFFLVRYICQQYSPDELFIDQHLNHYYFLLKSVCQQITLINTKLPTRRVSGIPPLTCSIPFKQNRLYWFFAELLWLHCIIHRKMESIVKKIVFLGIDDKYFIERIAQKEGINIYKQRRQYNSLYESITSTSIIHLRPQFLEYDWYKLDQHERFIYYPYQYQSAEDFECTHVNSIIKMHMSIRESRKSHLVYASLGTLSNIGKTEAVQFLHRLITVVEKQQNINLIISAGDLYSCIYYRESERVFVLRKVPQPELLRYCDLMITHGGLNSVCECLMTGTPMLVYPLNTKGSDQPGNAARIVTKKFGLQGSLRKDTKLEIKKKIVKLLTDNTFQQNVRKVKILPIEYWHLTTDLAKSK